MAIIMHTNKISLILSVLFLARTVLSASWHYGRSGPFEWHKDYPDCGGYMQSPININTHRVLYDDLLKPFDFHNYAAQHQGENVTLINKAGHTVELDYTGTPIVLSGGSLPDSYVLDQFHFHWGSGDLNGSEHTIDGSHFPMEMHLVHHQAHLNRSTAASHPFGLAVIAFMIGIGDTNHHFNQLLSHFDEIHEENQHVSFPFLRLKNLLPKGTKHYFRYFGSLTTPPCSESVIWSIALDHITISDHQLGRFQNFINNANKTILNNFRPTQHLRYRRVTSSLPRRDDINSGAVRHLVTWLIVAVCSLVLPSYI